MTEKTQPEDLTTLLTDFSENTLKKLTNSGLSPKDIEYLKKFDWQDATQATETIFNHAEKHQVSIALARRTKFGWQTFVIINSAIDNNLVSGGGIKLKQLADPHSNKSFSPLLTINIEAAQAMADKFAISGPYRYIGAESVPIGGAKMVGSAPSDGRSNEQATIEIIETAKPLLENFWGTAGDENVSYNLVAKTTKKLGLFHPQQGIAVGLGFEPKPTANLLDEICQLPTTIPGLDEITIIDMASSFTGLAALETIASSKGISLDKLTVAIQGTGTIGKPLLALLDEKGIKIAAVANKKGIVKTNDPTGLPVQTLIESIEENTREWTDGARKKFETLGLEFLAPKGSPAQSLTQAVDGLHLDVILPCATAHAVTQENMQQILTSLKNSPVKAIISLANDGIDHNTENALIRKGIIIPPDFINNFGVASLFALVFEKIKVKNAEDILTHLSTRTQKLVNTAIDIQNKHQTSARNFLPDLQASIK